MLQNDLLVWILAGLVCLLVGKEIGKWLPKWKPSLKSSSLLEKRQASARFLAAKLREVGLQLVTDVKDALDRVEDVAEIVKEGNDAILKELEGTYQRVLDAKLRTPEGRAAIRARLEGQVPPDASCQTVKP